MYHLLVVDRGWTSDHYQQWLGETLQAMLVREFGPGRHAGPRGNSRRPPDNAIRLSGGAPGIDPEA